MTLPVTETRCTEDEEGGADEGPCDFGPLAPPGELSCRGRRPRAHVCARGGCATLAAPAWDADPDERQLRPADGLPRAGCDRAPGPQPVLADAQGLADARPLGRTDAG